MFTDTIISSITTLPSQAGNLGWVFCGSSDMTQHGLDLRGHLYTGLPAAALLDNAPHLRRYIQALLELVGKLALVLGSQQSLCHEDAAKGKKCP